MASEPLDPQWLGQMMSKKWSNNGRKWMEGKQGNKKKQNQALQVMTLTVKEDCEKDYYMEINIGSRRRVWGFYLL